MKILSFVDKKILLLLFAIIYRYLLIQVELERLTLDYCWSA